MKPQHPFFLILLIFFSVSTLFAAFERKGTGASQIGLSLAGSASFNTSFSSFINPALVGKEKESVGLFYQNYFGLRELNQISLHTRFSINSWPIGIGISRFGNKLYSETELVVASAYKINDDLIIGAGSSIYFLEIKNYNSSFTVGLSLSLLYSISPQLNIAMVVNNFNEPQIGSAKETIPLSGTLGIMYAPINQVELLFDVYKEDFFDFEYRMAARITVINGINMLLGFRENINSFSAGLEYRTEGYSIKYAIDIHPIINVSHALGFNYAF